MLEVFKYALAEPADADKILAVELPWDQRKRSRIRCETTCGLEVGLFLERGNVLHANDLLQAETGELLRIIAAPEAVSTVTADDELIFLKVAYHLGNRHVPLEINQAGENNYLRYLEDYVLDDMAKELGASVKHEVAPFHPESGAYKHGGSHHHHDDHDEDHAHHHSHQDGRSHG